MKICNTCYKREGQLISQVAEGAQPEIGIKAPWVFRYYECQ